MKLNSIITIFQTKLGGVKINYLHKKLQTIMKSNKKAILRMLEKQGDSLSVKQIRGSLGLEKAVTAKLKAELLKLIKAGKIAKHGTRYKKSYKITERTGSKAKTKGNIEKIKTESVWEKTHERWPRRSSGKTETGYTASCKRFIR